ncbi:MAG: MATE family efflux transporter [Phycisphaeraceae bacterium]|nr:MATE family efflux transporter [Phycisphaeraceae bacterium]
MLRIALPSIVTMTSYTVMQFIDGLMVSRIRPIDPVNLAAQGNGGMAAWVVMGASIGLFGVINTYVAQNLGAGRPERGSAYGWSAIWMAMAMAAVAIPYALVVPSIYAALGHHEPLITLESRYAQILIFGAFFTMAARGLANYFYGLHRARVVMIAALVCNVSNVLLNMLLIFGRQGMAPTGWVVIDAPAASITAFADAIGLDGLGVAGAAYATVSGAAIELFIPLALFLSPRMNRLYATRAAWRPSRAAMSDIIRIGWPGALMMINEIFCWAFLMTYLLAAAGRAAGEDPVVHNTAGWIALRYMHVSFMPAIGLSFAVTAVVGRCLGMRRPDLAERRAWLGLRLTLTYMGLCAAAFVLFRGPMSRAFIPAEMSPEQAQTLVRVASHVLIAAAVFQIFDAAAITMLGALRGAGDTVWPGVLTIVLSWGCIVGGGWLIVALVPNLGSLGPWIAASTYIVLLGLGLLTRFIRGRWREITLLDPESKPLPAAEPERPLVTIAEPS